MFTFLHGGILICLFFFPSTVFFFIGICTDTSVFEAVETQHFEPLNWKMTDVFFAGMKAEGKWNWNEHVLMFRIDGMWKKNSQRQTTLNTFEVIIWACWKMVIDRRNQCRFFPVDIAGYEKWHLVVAIFCSQQNKPQLFCIECNANFVWLCLYRVAFWV